MKRNSSKFILFFKLTAAINSVCIALLVCELMVDVFLLGKVNVNRFGTFRHLTCVIITYNIIPTFVIIANPKMRMKLKESYFNLVDVWINYVNRISNTKKIHTLKV